jgi:hypothetical protein
MRFVKQLVLRVSGAPQGYETAHSSLMKGRSFCSFCVSSVCDIGHFDCRTSQNGARDLHLYPFCVHIYNGFKVGDSDDATYEAFKLEKRIVG